MNLRDTPEEAAFRAEVRGWLEANLPAESGPDWSRKLRDAGLAGTTWPEEYGGRGLPWSHQAIVLEELARAEAPIHSKTSSVAIYNPQASLLPWAAVRDASRGDSPLSGVRPGIR